MDVITGPPGCQRHQSGQQRQVQPEPCVIARMPDGRLRFLHQWIPIVANRGAIVGSGDLKSDACQKMLIKRHLADKRGFATQNGLADGHQLNSAERTGLHAAAGIHIRHRGRRRVNEGRHVGSLLFIRLLFFFLGRGLHRIGIQVAERLRQHVDRRRRSGSQPLRP